MVKNKVESLLLQTNCVNKGSYRFYSPACEDAKKKENLPVARFSE